MIFKLKRFIPVMLSLAFFLGLLSFLSITQAATLPNINAPTIQSIRPSYGCNDRETWVYIEGSGYVAPVTVTLRHIPLEVKEVESLLITAIVPRELTPSLYDITVEITGGLTATRPAAYHVLQPTTIDYLESYPESLWTDPRTMRIGYTNSGLGLNVQRLGGGCTNVLKDVTVEFVLKLPTGDVVLDRSEIPLLAPNSNESTGKVIWEPEMPGRYYVCAIIDPDNEIPETDESETSNEICRTVTVLEQTADITPPIVYETSFDIGNGAQTTVEQAVTLDATGIDPPPLPRSGLDALKFIEFEYILGVGWVPVQGSDWIPYGTAHQDYPWMLWPTYGSRHIRVWGVDKAGNISLDWSIDDINLLPSEQIASVAEDEVDFYRILVQTGETLSATLTPENGDPDLYIWGPSNNSPWYSNRPNGIEVLQKVITETGTYQLEVHGHTDAEYRLNFEILESSNESLRASQGSSSKSLPTAPSLRLDDIPNQDLYIDPPRFPVSNNIYLPMTTR